ncbi:hypothetical protein Tco_0429212 [Tanacetum coccineum]
MMVTSYSDETSWRRRVMFVRVACFDSDHIGDDGIDGDALGGEWVRRDEWCEVVHENREGDETRSNSEDFCGRMMISQNIGGSVNRDKNYSVQEEISSVVLWLGFEDIGLFRRKGGRIAFTREGALDSSKYLTRGGHIEDSVHIKHSSYKRLQEDDWGELVLGEDDGGGDFNRVRLLLGNLGEVGSGHNFDGLLYVCLRTRTVVQDIAVDQLRYTDSLSIIDGVVGVGYEILVSIAQGGVGASLTILDIGCVWDM